MIAVLLNACLTVFEWGSDLQDTSDRFHFNINNDTSQACPKAHVTLQAVKDSVNERIKGEDSSSVSEVLCLATIAYQCHDNRGLVLVCWDLEHFDLNQSWSELVAAQRRCCREFMVKLSWCIDYLLSEKSGRPDASFAQSVFYKVLYLVEFSLVVFLNLDYLEIVEVLKM